jgi:hypothetical protein
MGRGLLLLQKTRPEEFNARLAHELGHIANRDVGVAFLAQGLIVVAALTLLIEFAHWLALGASSLLRGWQQWQSTGATFARFLQAWSSWIGQVALLGLARICKTVFWVVILVAEHRAFLRVRELYADSFAAMAIGPQAIENTVGERSAHIPQSFWRSAREFLFSSHPALAWRRAVIRNPLRLFEPRPARMAAVGYVIGLLLTAGLDIKTPDIPGTFDVVMIAVFTTIEGAASFLFITTFLLAPMLAIGTLILLSASWASLSELSVLERAYRIAQGFICLGLGVLLGLSLNPIYLQSFADSAGEVRMILPDVADLTASSVITLIIFIEVVVYAGVIRRLLHSRRPRPPSRAVWILIGVTMFASAQELITLVVSFLDPPPDLNKAATLRGWFAGYTVIFWLFAYLLARRTISPQPQGTKTIAPWMYGGVA